MQDVATRQLRLITIRHGQPDVPSGHCYGNTDLALKEGVNDLLLAQHDALFGQARAECWPVYSSPLQRCASLAAAVSPDFRADSRLREWDFGAWEMFSWDSVPRSELDAWAADPVNYKPGGCENLLMIVQRLHSFLHELPVSDKAYLLITHAGVIRLLSVWQASHVQTAMAAQASVAPSYGARSDFNISLFPA